MLSLFSFSALSAASAVKSFQITLGKQGAHCAPYEHN